MTRRSPENGPPRTSARAPGGTHPAPAVLCRAVPPLAPPAVRAGARAIVQCRRLAPGRALGAPVVQQLVGSQHIYSADQAWLVTTGTLTHDAGQLASRMGVGVVDGPGLVNMAALTGAHALPAASQLGPPPWAR
jgi:hypothetical protein